MATVYADRRGLLITVSGRLATEQCHKCGIMFAMPEEFMANVRRDKATEGDAK